MSVISGIAASKGIAKGAAYIYHQNEIDITEDSRLSQESELERFKDACDKAAEEISRLRLDAIEAVGSSEAQIFEAQEMMIRSPDFEDSVQEWISRGKTAEYSVRAGSEALEKMLYETGDDYLMERTADVRDISGRVIRVLLGVRNEELPDFPHILIADDLLPSQTIAMDKTKILGIATSRGAYNSHTAILARTLGIPAVVGCGDMIKVIRDGSEIIINGTDGTVQSEIDETAEREFERLKREFDEHKNSLEKLKDMPSVTADGSEIEICANIGSLEDAQAALENGADGVGLFRTEFLYMESTDFPSEEAQFEVYKTVLEMFKGKRVIVRTFDIGADKSLPYMDLGNEENPAMGCRAIRVCLNNSVLFKTQLNALLRASKYGRLAIMFPMISELKELRACKDMIRECMKELDDRGLEYLTDIEIGIMVEVPAAAVMSDEFAKEADFFSIGTNDLSQFTMAADRTNEKVNYLCDASQEAVLRLIGLTAKNATANGILCGVCGELAGDPEYTEKLLRMGVRELSMSPFSILEVRKKVREIRLDQ